MRGVETRRSGRSERPARPRSAGTRAGAKSMKLRRKAATIARVSAAVVVALLFSARAGHAGPPFVTDDPVPVDLGKWEINNFANSTFAGGALQGNLFAVDANYGAAENLQLHLQIPSAMAQWSGASAQFGLGDIEIGAKYRFLAPGDDEWLPQVAIFPLLDFPTGDANRDLGTGRAHAFLPIWLQKNIGKWSIFGGGGYWLNPGPGNVNYWFSGLAAQYQLTDALSLGGEIFYQTKSTDGGPGSPGYPLGSRNSAGFNLGGTYDFDKTRRLLFSFGRGLLNASTTNSFSYYLALQVSF